ncbi:hypothetical protein Y032_0171g332 [Ancylostoma ceylanicum]|uniref:Uncharacterized protein n=1 Tax=Ancylostoma ceylanicum TaxID=53326 RepID=A0A016SUV5_9BILA|nr:hypothetical protein Y032_0171g332 [Ancylostoma ceylanicum]
MDPLRKPLKHHRNNQSARLACNVQCIRNDESAEAVYVTPGSLLDIRKTTMKRDTHSRYDDMDCSQAWLPRPLGRTRRFEWTVDRYNFDVDVMVIIMVQNMALHAADARSHHKYCTFRLRSTTRDWSNSIAVIRFSLSISEFSQYFSDFSATFRESKEVRSIMSESSYTVQLEELESFEDVCLPNSAVGLWSVWGDEESSAACSLVSV